MLTASAATLSPIPMGAGPNAPAAAKYRQKKSSRIGAVGQPPTRGRSLTLHKPMASQPTATRRRTRRPGRRVPATQVSLSRVGVTGVEKVIRVKADGAENLFYAELRVLRRPQPAAGRRPHVPLRGDRRRGDRRGRARRGLQGRGARRPRRPEGARAPGRPARRGLGHRALPGDGRRRRRAARAPRRSTSSSAPRSPPSTAPAR